MGTGIKNVITIPAIHEGPTTTVRITRTVVAPVQCSE